MDSTTAAVSGVLVLGAFIAGGVLGFLLFRAMQRRTERQIAVDKEQIQNGFTAAANQFLVTAQTSLLTSAKEALERQSQAQSSELQTKKELIDQRLQDTNASLSILRSQIDAFDGKQAEVLGKFRTDFTRNAEETLKNAQHTLLTVAEERLKRETAENVGELDTRKQLIDQRLDEVNATLEKVRGLMQEFDGKQDSRMSGLDAQIRLLTQTTTGLERALKDNRARGQLGEQIAESILDLCGLILDVHYRKQQSIEADNGKVRPDFTFMLPNGLKLNMDSKFPLDNYLEYLHAESETEGNVLKERFLKNDVRARIKEVTSKEYINVKQNTLDYVLLFIPSEPVYRFMLDEDANLFAEALQKKVVLCSPLTLYSIVQVIHQAARNFRVEQNAQEILSVLTEFTKQWQMFADELDKMGDQLDRAQDQYRKLSGVRTDKLQKQMDRTSALSAAAELSEVVVQPVAIAVLESGE